jgi:glutamine amidotransferase
MIAIIDYDVGNLAAVANMLNRLGVECEVTASLERVEAADHIVLPGNGAFDVCIRNLRATGLIPLLERKVHVEGTPLLGICVGAQMLGHASEEGCERGLGWLDMNVRRFPSLPGVKVPHMGWTDVCPTSADHSLLQGMMSDPRFYFVHSFYMAPERRENVILEAEYGIRFAAGVANNNIFGVQFHPEKSHRFGKWLLRNFARNR